MSDVTTIGTWRAEATTVGAVEEAIARLRRQEDRAAVRVAVLTLVALVEAGECAGALDTVRALGGRHPTHAILIVAGDPAALPALDADVRVHSLERGDRAVCFEDVLLQVSGPTVGHLDSLLEPLALADVPVVLWLPGRLPALDDPLLSAVERVVVDTRELGDPAVLADVVTLTRRFPVTDLSWVRLAPWRELLAGLFEGGAFRPFLDGVRSVRVAGRAGPRHLLAGWLVSRLDLPADAVTLVEAPHVTIGIESVAGGRRGRFEVSRSGDERVVHAGADVQGGPSHARTLRLRDRDPARVLGEALARVGRDRTWEEALAAAIGFTGPPDRAS